MRTTQWKPIEDKALKQAHADGLSLLRLCVRLNRNAKGIEARLKVLGLACPTPQRLPREESSEPTKDVYPRR
jgi:hypothetical protein